MLWGLFNKRHKLKEDWHLSGPFLCHRPFISFQINNHWQNWMKRVSLHDISGVITSWMWTYSLFELPSQTWSFRSSVDTCNHRQCAYLAKSCKVCSSYGYSTRHIIFSSQNRVTSRGVPAHAGTVLHRPLSMEWSEIPKYLQHQGSVFSFWIHCRAIHPSDGLSQPSVRTFWRNMLSVNRPLPGVADQLA